MATTNIDAVAEFKILTNSYQAEYGRATGGQIQIVTKSGTQSFHGSGYWYGRRSDWNANTWTNKRAAAPPPVGSGAAARAGGDLPQRLRLHARRADLHPRRLQRGQEEAVLLLEPGVPAAHGPRERAARPACPTALERLGDFSQSVDSSGNPFPYIRDYTTGLPCRRGRHARAASQDGGVLGPDPAEPPVSRPASQRSASTRTPNFTAGSGVNFTSQDPNESPRREDLLRLDFQATDKWRFTGRYMKTKEDILQAYGTTWAGNGSDQLPMPVHVPAPGLELHAVRDRHPEPDDVARDERGPRGELAQLRPPDGQPVPLGGGSHGDAAALPRRRAGGLHPLTSAFPTDGRTGNAGQYQTDRGPFTNENITWDALANLTKIWGSHSAKFGVYFQHSYKPQSIFASFNSQIDFIDDSANPFDTGYSYANAATRRVQHSTRRPPSSRCPSGATRTSSGTRRTTGRSTSRFTLDYGVRFYYLTPQWDTTLQASNFLPDQFNPSQAAQPVPARLHRRLPVLRRQPARHGPERSWPRAWRPTLANTVESRFIGRLTPDSDRFNGAFQAGQGINDELQDGNAFKVSPRLGFTYDVTGKRRDDRPRRRRDLLRPAAGQPGLRHDLERARRPELDAPVGPAPGPAAPASTGTDPNAVLALNPSAYDFEPPKTYQWNLGVQHKVW